MKQLSEVDSFGGTDADDDPLLLVAFEDNRSYLSVRKLEKYLVLGRKGSGKTAVFRKLLNAEADNLLVEGHVFTDYPWHHHSQQRSAGVPDELCYVASWEYLINVSFAKLLLNKDPWFPASDEALAGAATLESFIVDTYGTRDPLISNVFTPSQTIKVKANAELDFKIGKAGIEAERVSLQHLPTIVQEVNLNLLESIFSSATPDIQYIVCFDELDLGFRPDDEDYAQRLMGLLVAAKRFNNTAKRRGKALSVVVFLRSDIFQVIKFEDRNKILESGATTLSWDVPTGPDKLSSLMEKRFKSALASDQDLAWDDIFDESQQMTSRQRKYSHILDRTFLRPRDIIKFCNEVLAAYKTRKGTGKFSNEDIISARRPYSSYLYRELEDELPKHFVDYAIYFDVIKEIGVTQFSKQTFEAAFSLHAGRLKEKIEPDTALARLFEFSIVAYLRSGGGAYGSQYVWKHKNAEAVFSDRASSFRVHYGLVEYLELRRKQVKREGQMTLSPEEIDEFEADEIPAK
ncbi:P-loop ATPase, Sll1717 family [Paracoccus sanguinis]|uniref:P-loop ATPase, Sll1717 family n=1 Tax=Paracoccus sanguinis TaxID=1545044 RepID=UPI0012DFF3D5|nr:hypothetical protein [Paracoccus sanguinis]